MSSPRLALLNRLVTDWNPTNTDGWDPTVDWGADNRLYAHLGEYDDEMPEPQLTVQDVSAAGGYTGHKGDGSGPVADYFHRIDVGAWTDPDAVSRSPTESDADELAALLGREVRRIAHANAQVLIDPASGERAAHRLEPIAPYVRADADASLTRYQAVVEIQYRTREDPPVP